MRFALLLSALLAAVVPAAHAATASPADLTQIVSTMPSCGLLCLEENIAASPCALTDTECSCANATLTAQVEACVLTSCKVKEQLATKNATQTLCGAPVRDRTNAVSVSGIVGGIFALIAYVLRMVSRFPHFGGTLGWDDAAMTFVVVLVAPLTCLAVANLGLGKDIWTLPFDNITHILYVSIPARTLLGHLAHEIQIYYFDEDLYLSALPMLKISILLFYLRIFPEKGFRKIVFVTMGLCAGYAIAFVLVSVFQCRPIKYAWLQWDDEHEGSCNNINAQGWSSAALNVILDVIVIVLPLPQLWQLQLNERKKFLPNSHLQRDNCQYSASPGPNRVRQHAQPRGDYTAVGYWSTIEIHVGIMGSQMPAMRSLFMNCIPKVMGQTTGNKSYGATSSALSHGLSSSNNNPKGSQSNRAKGDDDGDSIPLVDVESQAGTSIGGAHSLPPTRAGYQET